MCHINENVLRSLIEIHSLKISINKFRQSATDSPLASHWKYFSLIILKLNTELKSSGSLPSGFQREDSQNSMTQKLYTWTSVFHMHCQKTAFWRWYITVYRCQLKFLEKIKPAAYCSNAITSLSCSSWCYCLFPFPHLPVFGISGP